MAYAPGRQAAVPQVEPASAEERLPFSTILLARPSVPTNLRVRSGTGAGTREAVGRGGRGLGGFLAARDPRTQGVPTPSLGRSPRAGHSLPWREAAVAPRPAQPHPGASVGVPGVGDLSGARAAMARRRGCRCTERGTGREPGRSPWHASHRMLRSPTPLSGARWRPCRAARAASSSTMPRRGVSGRRWTAASSPWPRS